MTQAFNSAALVGSTGQGSEILNILLSHPSGPKTYALGRRPLPQTSQSLFPLISPHTSTWTESLKSVSPSPPIFFSSLGTTKAAAGSIAAQRAIDYDLNLDLARAAKESGVKVYVLISAAGVSASSPFPYPKMKGQLEEEVKKLDFEHTVIVKPGLLLGNRQDRRPAEAVSRALANGLGAISNGWLTNSWAQDATVVARSAVVAGEQCLEGQRQKGVWIVGQGDIVKMGKSKRQQDKMQG
ncbi:MAG: hypothetical protein Q9195_000123 [Heterodermia aff. obscurata]